MKVYFISDLHMGRGWTNGHKCKADDFTARKEDLFIRLLQRVIDEEAQLYIVGDLFENYACSTHEIITGNLNLLRAMTKIVTGWVRGNHDPADLDKGWKHALKMRGSGMIWADNARIWVEHGHAFDASWQRGFAVKWGARALYWTERLFPGIDEGLARVLHRWQDRARKKANEQDERLPYWWGAWQRRQERKLAGLSVPDAVVFGHSHHMGIEDMSGWLYVNTGTWARDDQGREREDVTVYDGQTRTWWQGQAGEIP